MPFVVDAGGKRADVKPQLFRQADRALTRVERLSAAHELVVKVPEAALVGAALGGQRAELTLPAEDHEVPVFEPRDPGLDQLVEYARLNLSRETSANASLKVAVLDDHDGRVGVADRIAKRQRARSASVLQHAGNHHPVRIALALISRLRRDLLLNRNAEVATIRDCKTYLDLRQQGFRSRSDMEERYLQSIGAECYAIAALREGSPAKSTHVASFRLDEAAVAVLPPSCGVVVSEDEIKKVRAAEIEGLSWDKYDEALQTRMEDADVLVVEGRTWEARL